MPGMTEVLSALSNIQATTYFRGRKECLRARARVTAGDFRVFRSRCRLMSSARAYFRKTDGRFWETFASDVRMRVWPLWVGSRRMTGGVQRLLRCRQSIFKVQARRALPGHLRKFAGRNSRAGNGRSQVYNGRRWTPQAQRGVP